MNILTKAFAAASLASAAVIATPAAAQVNGIATVELDVAVIQAQAFSTGYQQIDTQYASQQTTIQQQQQQRQQLVRSFDTNGNGQIDADEQGATQDPNNATVRQVQAIDQEVARLQQPINLARLYVVSQIAQQYRAALNQVISDRNIQFVMAPEVFIHAPQGSDITQLVAAQLNTRVPTVSTTPPANWQPGDAVIGLYQQIQQRLVAAAQQQAIQQQQQAQQPAAQPSGR